MSIQEHLKKINPAMWPETVTTSLIIVLVAFGSFGLGRLSRIEEPKSPLEIKANNGAEAQVVSIPFSGDLKPDTNIKSAVGQSLKVDKITVSNEGFIVASKTGKKYHFPWCAGAQQIKEENKVWFASEAEAKAAGFTPAANCKGL
ncbi:MAG: hypothetical protein HZB09_01070 [Candidatus Yonathbacteria bacterium]|nr:hypothetical protein [Candidatus Yonathbacteria bacterium]